ncbi:hypothetical protein PRIPAC_74258 [Pristionchus pacificus]|uniref:SCP domain-containing protein n=1 Tax=Pristionchus pacificus TaxID=54126 RepID=A0A2A6BF26_PRIPA|nr:hypothetical protein PRIPAC_74258 [Pristionchus pacificus]|eukprot:PDM64484.1 hypothetical protein PRIPAC_52740 [Pristionchus pacificus]
MVRICLLLGLLSLVSLVHSQCTGGIPTTAGIPTTSGQIPSTEVDAVAVQCTGGIPAAEVKGFLDAHNKLRQSISAGTYVAKGKTMPAAKTPIPNLTWDCDLEKSAQKVAATCVFAHSQNRNNTGENLYTYWSSDKISFAGQGKAASDYWEKEFQDYGWPSIKMTNALFSSGVGHATQMAWAKTTKMGCGMSLCDGGKKIIVACQYRDAGNMMGENIYDAK